MAVFGFSQFKSIKFRNEYSAIVQYLPGDAVQFQGSGYVCVMPSIGNDPTNEEFWGLFASKGDQGPPGAGASFFLSAKPSAVPGYGMFSPTPYGLEETSYSATLSTPGVEYLLASFVTNGSYHGSHIPPGPWSFHISASVNHAGGITQLVHRVYKRTSLGVETEIFSVTSDEINNTDPAVIETDYALSIDTQTDPTDEIVVKLFGITDSNPDRTLTITVDGTGHASHVETTLGVAFDPEAPQTIKAPWTFVVPAGQSFRVFDDVENPTVGMLFSNRDADVTTSEMQFTAQWYGINGCNGQLKIAQDVDTESVDYGKGIVTSFLANTNDTCSSVLTLNVDGTSSFVVTADQLSTPATEVIFSGLPTYADNAAALAAGLPVGADYNTPAGVRMVVIPGE